MRKLTIADAAVFFGITKEAVYNRIRRKALKSVDENGFRYVIIDDDKEKNSQKSTKQTSNLSHANPQKISKNSSEFINYLIKEIDELKTKNQILQDSKDELHRQKEELLISTKEEIKNLYETRDQKLQYFLEAISRPIKQIDYVESDEKRTNWISFWKFLNKFKGNKKYRKAVKKFLIKNIDNNPQIRSINGEFFVDENIDLSRLKD